MTKNSKAMLEAARKGIAWLVSQQKSDGRYQEEDDLNAYYKSPYPLRVGGEPQASARCLNHIVRRYMTDKGDFMNSPEQRGAGTYTRLWCQIYPNFWILRAACATYQFALAQKIYRFLLSCRDEKTGGLYYEVDRKSGLLDSNSTACLCLSGLLCGDLAGAQRAGDSLLYWKQAQKDPLRFYLRWSPAGELRTRFPEEEALYWMVDAQKPAQFYWQVGLPLVALAKLHQVTSQRKYLDGAVGLIDFSLSCQPDVMAAYTVGKLGYGAAVLYKITGDQRYLDINRKITEYYLQTQHSDGYWLAPQHKNLQDQPLRLTTDLTGEFCAWQLDYLAELGDVL